MDYGCLSHLNDTTSMKTVRGVHKFDGLGSFSQKSFPENIKPVYLGFRVGNCLANDFSIFVFWKRASHMFNSYPTQFL